MKTKFLLLLLLLVVVVPAFSITWQVTNSGFSFTPATVTIHLGDNVNFTLDANHNAVEVSSATWNANGAASNGGFNVDFGGGLVAASLLTVGTHYYVCQPHASSGMKAKIVVLATTAVAETQMPLDITLAPNPASSFIRITANENNLIGSHYALFDRLGRQMLMGKLTDKVTSVPVYQLASGLYFMQIIARSTETFKVMIK
jgi:plastocyanin